MSITAKLATEPPEHLLLRPARGKKFWLLTISLIFTVAGISMINSGDPKKGWFVMLFSGLATVLFAIQLLWPGASYLRLSPDGFVVCALFRPSPLIRWDTVSEFHVVRVPPKRTKMVGFDVDASLLPSLAATVRYLTGTNGALPDTYGQRPDELADLMNEWRRKALRARQIGRSWVPNHRNPL